MITSCNEPDFFITSTEHEPVLNPRKCWVTGKVWLSERGEDSLVVSISPSIQGKQINLDQELIDTLILVTRHLGTSLLPLSEAPVYVYICIPKTEMSELGSVKSTEDLQVLMIGNVYESLEDAEKAIKTSQDRRRIRF